MGLGEKRRKNIVICGGGGAGAPCGAGENRGVYTTFYTQISGSVV